MRFYIISSYCSTMAPQYSKIHPQGARQTTTLYGCMQSSTLRKRNHLVRTRLFSASSSKTIFKLTVKSNTARNHQKTSKI